MADNKETPQLHILDGPNGVGKATPDHNRIAPKQSGTPFVNPDIQAY
jgi:predicted ABC-type ATPase